MRDRYELLNFFNPSETVGCLSGGNLPHWRQDGVVYFVTFRTADSMPAERVAQWTRERDAWLASHPEPRDAATRAEYARLFPQRWHQWLDEGHGACRLRDPGVLRVVEACLTHDDGQSYRLEEHIIMPNHVHALVVPNGDKVLSDIVQAWKSVSAHRINKILQRRGTFWQKESFDHIVRNADQMERIRQYIRDNPTRKKVDAAPSPR